MSYNYDPELADIISSLPEGDLDDPVAARASLSQLLGPFNANLDVSALELEEKRIPGLDRAPDIRVRIYSPKRKASVAPGLLYIHGGGFVVGDIDTEHAGAAAIAEGLGVVVVSVDYRLAPENPFPAGLEDCYASLVWVHENAAGLGIDPERIGVFGQSAGGGLSAALTLMARDKGGPAFCFQYLGMPELDDRLRTVSMREFTDTPMWRRSNAVLSWRYYLGAAYKPGGDDVPVYAAPARARTDQLKGLPPTYISAMEFDPLRDEGLLYALRLMEAGVPVEVHAFPGTFHGSALVRHAAVSQRQNAEMLEVLRRGLKHVEQEPPDTSSA